MMSMIYWGMNPAGIVSGYYSSYDVISTVISLYFLVTLLMICIAINTSNWIWIGLAALSTVRGAGEGWPTVSWVLTIFVSSSLTILAIFFACYQTVQDNYQVFFFIASGYGIVMCLFSVLSAAVVIATIKNIDNADPKLLYRTAVQVAILCFGELVASVLLIVISGLPPSTYTNGMIYYGIGFIFPVLVLWALQLLLLLQFRIAVWQLKEVAMPRINTIASATSSARKTANSYTDSMSKGMSATSVENNNDAASSSVAGGTGKQTQESTDRLISIDKSIEEPGKLSKKTEEEVELGVITL